MVFFLKEVKFEYTRKSNNKGVKGMLQVVEVEKREETKQKEVELQRRI